MRHTVLSLNNAGLLILAWYYVRGRIFNPVMIISRVIRPSINTVFRILGILWYKGYIDFEKIDKSELVSLFKEHDRNPPGVKVARVTMRILRRADKPYSWRLTERGLMKVAEIIRHHLGKNIEDVDDAKNYLLSIEYERLVNLIHKRRQDRKLQELVNKLKRIKSGLPVIPSASELIERLEKDRALREKTLANLILIERKDVSLAGASIAFNLDLDPLIPKLRKIRTRKGISLLAMLNRYKINLLIAPLRRYETLLKLFIYGDLPLNELKVAIGREWSQLPSFNETIEALRQAEYISVDERGIVRFKWYGLGEGTGLDFTTFLSLERNYLESSIRGISLYIPRGDMVEKLKFSSITPLLWYDLYTYLPDLSKVSDYKTLISSHTALGRTLDMLPASVAKKIVEEELKDIVKQYIEVGVIKPIGNGNDKVLIPHGIWQRMVAVLKDDKEILSYMNMLKTVIKGRKTASPLIREEEAVRSIMKFLNVGVSDALKIINQLVESGLLIPIFSFTYRRSYLIAYDLQYKYFEILRIPSRGLEPILLDVYRIVDTIKGKQHIELLVKILHELERKGHASLKDLSLQDYIALQDTLDYMRRVSWIKLNTDKLEVELLTKPIKLGKKKQILLDPRDAIRIIIEAIAWLEKADSIPTEQEIREAMTDPNSLNNLIDSKRDKYKTRASFIEAEEHA